MQDITLDLLTVNDALEVQGLAAAVGWQFSSLQVRTFLSAGYFYGHRQSGRLVSSAGLFPYTPDLSAIGIVLVHPDYQRQGLGREIVTSCLQQETAGASFVLVATEMGYPLYSSLGFRVHSKIGRFLFTCRAGNGSSNRSRLENTPVPSSSQSTLGYRVEDITSDYMEDIIQLDKKTFGAGRRRVYRSIWKQVDGGKVALRGRTLVGFVLGLVRKSHFQASQLVVSALTADSEAIALDLVHQLVTDELWDGHPFQIRMDVPFQQESFISKLNEMGYVCERTSPIMILGQPTLPGYQTGTYSLLDPAFG